MKFSNWKCFICSYLYKNVVLYFQQCVVTNAHILYAQTAFLKLLFMQLLLLISVFWITEVLWFCLCIVSVLQILKSLVKFTLGKIVLWNACEWKKFLLILQHLKILLYRVMWTKIYNFIAVLKVLKWKCYLLFWLQNLYIISRQLFFYAKITYL